MTLALKYINYTDVLKHTKFTRHKGIYSIAKSSKTSVTEVTIWK